ncbi:HNH endonuclease [bacterium]|nr:HNH endonuclease [bacterium]
MKPAELQIGQVLSNTEVKQAFSVGHSGGMRRSLKTNSLVLISDHTRGVYEDRWENGILHYTGMGLIGDQDLQANQNKTLCESNTNGVSVYLFEVFAPGEYTYVGPVSLVDTPRQERQPDAEGSLRSVWVFPLRAVGVEPYVPDESKLLHKQRLREKRATKLSDQELISYALTSKSRRTRRESKTVVYERNEYVAELARRRANGVCQLCESPAPFLTKENRPFLEVHHIKWLSLGGLDDLSNTVALCPNCHRRMHLLDLTEDRNKLIAVVNAIEGRNSL